MSLQQLPDRYCLIENNAAIHANPGTTFSITSLPALA